MRVASRCQAASVSFRFVCLVWQLLLFCVVYTLSNEYASEQMVVRHVMTPWDAYVPFIDWMIAPYSLSLPLFVYAFLQTNNRVALLKLSQQVTLATLLAGWGFYCFPLAFSTALPDIDEHWRWAYQWLHFVDRPYNQLPSLHVVYSLIFGCFLLDKQNHSHARSCLYSVAVVVISLSIIVSTVFTYQHHLMDVFAGVLLACALIFILKKRLFQPIAFFYFSLACLWSLLVLLLALPWLLFYFSGTFVCVGCAYAGNKTHEYSNKNALFPSGSGVFLVPYRFMYWLMWRFKAQPYQAILPYLSVGRRLKNDEVAAFSSDTYCIDVSCELGKTKTWNLARYQSFPLLDLQPISREQALGFCELMTSLKRQDPNAAFYVHCVMGISRSYAMVACYLVYSGQQTADKVRGYLMNVNPKCVLPEHYLSQAILEDMASISRKEKTI